MRLSVMLEPQEGLSYAQQLAVAQHAEAVGLAGFYRSDHYSSVRAGVGLPSTDAWAAPTRRMASIRRCRRRGGRTKTC